MDFSDRIPNISAVHRKLGGSYDKLYRQLHGTMPVTRESRALAIEAATDGVIKAAWLLGLEDPPPVHSSPPGKSGEAA